MGNHLATAQMIPDKFTQFILKEAVHRARGHLRARLATDQLIPDLVLRVPFHFRNSSTVIRTGILASTAMLCL
jgi:hypothetical protein